MRRAAIVLALGIGLPPTGAIAGSDPSFCPPRTGAVVPLRRDFRAPAEGIVLLFSAASNEAEFRGCDGEICVFRLHRKVRSPAGEWVSSPIESRGFGQRLEVPRDAVAGLVSMPDCPAPKAEPAPAPKRPKIRRRKRARRRRHIAKVPVVSAAPEPPPTVAPRATAAPAPPSIAALISSPGFDALTLDAIVEDSQSTSAAAFPAIRAGRPTQLGRRVAVVVADNGSLAFTAQASSAKGELDPGPAPPPPPYWMLSPGVPNAGLPNLNLPPIPGASGTGEGLNAIDGVDIDAPLKRAYARATFDARYQMYLENRDENTRESLHQLLSTLEALRDDPKLSTAQRELAIRRLHALPTDSDLPAVNESFANAKAQAQALIEDFSRFHLHLELSQQPVARAPDAGVSSAPR